MMEFSWTFESAVGPITESVRRRERWQGSPAPLRPEGAQKGNGVSGPWETEGREQKGLETQKQEAGWQKRRSRQDGLSRRRPGLSSQAQEQSTASVGNAQAAPP